MRVTLAVLGAVTLAAQRRAAFPEGTRQLLGVLAEPYRVVRVTLGQPYLGLQEGDLVTFTARGTFGALANALARAPRGGDLRKRTVDLRALVSGASITITPSASSAVNMHEPPISFSAWTTRRQSALRGTSISAVAALAQRSDRHASDGPRMSMAEDLAEEQLGPV